MTKQKKSPKVRFAGFTEDWKEKDLENEVAFYTGLTYSPNDVVSKSGTLVIRSSNIKNGQLVNADNVYVDSSVVNSENVKAGDIAVVVRNGSRSLIGKHAQIHTDLENTVIGAFMTGIRSEKNCDFIYALLDTKQFKKEIEKNLGATINQITTGAFKKMQFHFPDKDEQKRIGVLFRKINESISFHKTKYDKLQNLKKAMLIKMFPQNGAAVPEMRFKGFEDEWKKRRLDEICDIIGGGTPSTMDKDYWQGDIDWYAPTEIGDNPYIYTSSKKITVLGLESCGARLLPANKTVLFTSRAGIGKMAILGNAGCTNQGFQSLVLNDEINTYFIYSAGYLIKDYALTKASGSTFLEISSKVLGKMKIFIPKDDEQKKIGSYFQNLDHLIDMHKIELIKLNNIKKAFLNKLFVQEA